MNPRHIAVILDRSGSMATVQEDTEGGLRAFLAEQHATRDNTVVSLYQFDNRYETVYEKVPLAEVPDFTLHPRGMTALADAIGRTVATLTEQHTDNTSGEVIVVILTDGHENSSREYTLPQAKTMINLARKSGWKFVFLGADQDAFAAARSLGIPKETTLPYRGHTTEGSMTSAGRMVARGTRTGSFAFTDDERGQAGEE